MRIARESLVGFATVGLRLLVPNLPEGLEGTFVVSNQPRPSGATRPAPPSLDLPYYGIGFVDAVKRGFKKYATFTGRASRSEYWWWALFTFTGYLVLGLLAFALGTATSRDGGRTPGLLALPLIILFAVFLFGILIPTLAVTVRGCTTPDTADCLRCSCSSPTWGA